MDTLKDRARKVLTVVTAVPGIMLAVAVFLSAVTPDVLELLAELSENGAVETGWLDEGLTEWSARIVAWLTTGAYAVRRVTEVPAELVGLEPVRTVVTAVHPEGPDGP